MPAIHNGPNAVSTAVIKVVNDRTQNRNDCEGDAGPERVARQKDIKAGVDAAVEVRIKVLCVTGHASREGSLGGKDERSDPKRRLRISTIQRRWERSPDYDADTGGGGEPLRLSRRPQAG